MNQIKRSKTNIDEVLFRRGWCQRNVSRAPFVGHVSEEGFSLLFLTTSFGCVCVCTLNGDFSQVSHSSRFFHILCGTTADLVE